MAAKKTTSKARSHKREGETCRQALETRSREEKTGGREESRCGEKTSPRQKTSTGQEGRSPRPCYLSGGIPSRFGGRLSSVLDITPREGNRREFIGNAGISPITTHVVVEGPIKKDTISYLIAARTTYSNWILGLLTNPSLRNSRASFYDINARISYDIDKNNKVDLSAYYSKDAFRFNSDTVYKYENNIVNLRWRHFFSSRFFTGLSLNNSLYNYDISSERVKEEAFLLQHSINSTNFKADFNWYPGSRNEINFGADLTRYEVLPGSFTPLGDSSLVLPDVIPRQRAFEPALYIRGQAHCY